MSLSGENFYFSAFNCLKILPEIHLCPMFLPPYFAQQYILFCFCNRPTCFLYLSGEKGSEILFLLIHLWGVIEEIFHMLFHIISHLNIWYKSEQSVKCMGFTSLLVCPNRSVHLYLCRTQKDKTLMCSKRILWTVSSKGFCFQKKKVARKRPDTTERLWL